MLSFNKDEPTFRWTALTSVLDDWSVKRTLKKEEPVSTTMHGPTYCSEVFPVDSWNGERKRLSWFESGPDEPPIKKQRVESDLEEEEERSIWPYNWDWNGLFLHDFELLKLSDNVLLEILYLLDNASRREVSFTCHKLREIIVNDQSDDMERREILDTSTVWINRDIQFVMDRLVKMENERPQPSTVHKFQKLCSFLEYVKKVTQYFVFSNVEIHVDPKCNFGIAAIVKAFEEVSPGRMELFACDVRPLSIRLANTIVSAFRKFRVVKRIGFWQKMPVKWNEYCSTVTKWAESKEFEVKKEQNSEYTIAKEVRRGQNIIIIGSPKNYY